MISVMVGHFDCKHSCIVEKNVPIAFILPSRWQDGAESLVIERPPQAVFYVNWFCSLRRLRARPVL